MAMLELRTAPETGKRGSTFYFAWGCFRDFGSGTCGAASGTPKRDEASSNRHPVPCFCSSMISAQTLRVCREGKPVPTHRVVARGHVFPDYALMHTHLS